MVAVKLNVVLILNSKKMRYKVYHEMYREAVAEALKEVEAQGFYFMTDDVFNAVSVENKRPKAGETVRFILPLYKADKLQRKAANIQIYNRETEKAPFELNIFIN